jgi:aminopeptidase N
MLLVLAAVAAVARPPDNLPFDLPLAGKPGVRSSSFSVPRSSLSAESSHSYDVRFYRLDFDLPMTNAGYVCHEQVALAGRVPSLDTVVLDFAGMVCDSVKRAGVPLSFTTPTELLSIALDTPLPEDDSTVLDIFFHRDSTAQQIGYFFCKPPTRTYAHAMTCGCPRDNHYWFACYDLPSDKAERGIMMDLTVPDTFQTSSNGLCDSVTENSGNMTKTYWWRHPYPICPYLMTFSASRFARWGDTFVNSNGDTIPIIHFMWPEDSAATTLGYAHLLDMMQYFSDTTRFGPYPFERFGFIPGYYGFPWGGMEHQTTVMLHTSYIGGGSDVVQAHELSHMWWGDMVTHVGYADVWLNEGFGTWAEVLYMGHQLGRNEFNRLMRARASSYFSRDRSYRFPTYNPPWNQVYDYGTIYCKGAWVEHMLRYVEGDTAWEQPGVFFRALRAYRDSFAYGAVSTEDYKRINEQLTGLDLDWFFDEWIYQAGYPKYSVDWAREQVGDSFRITVTLGQSNGNLAPSVFHMPLPVRFYGPGADTLVTIRPQANPELDSFTLVFRPDSLVVDPDNWVLDSTYYTGIAEDEGSGFRGQGLGKLETSPNPARGQVHFQVWGAPETESDLLVLDPAGRLVARIPYRISAQGRATVTWNRRNNSGGKAASGVYFCRLASAPAARACRLTLVE